jgi:hypothetical protein
MNKRTVSEVDIDSDAQSSKYDTEPNQKLHFENDVFSKIQGKEY